jgi:hypothetical protein
MLSAGRYLWWRRASVLLAVLGSTCVVFFAFALLGASLSKTPEAVPGEVGGLLVGLLMIVLGLLGAAASRRPPPPGEAGPP